MVLRASQLLIGLFLYGAGGALLVVAGLGVDPWTVLAEGLSERTGLGIGWLTNLIGGAILLLWIPLRQHPGIGTLANIALLGTSMQVVLDILPPLVGPLARGSALATGVLLVAIASGMYIGARFGPGPRDGLMTGLHARWGAPIWLCRMSIEGSVLAVGWTLGGTVGIGTVVFAVGIGPLVHLALPIFATTAPTSSEFSAPGTRGAPRRA